MLEKKDHSLNERQQHIEEMESKVDEMIRMQQSELERISSLTRDEAKQIILDRVENELSHDIAIMTKKPKTVRKKRQIKRRKTFCRLLCSAVQQIMLPKRRYRSSIFRMMR